MIFQPNNIYFMEILFRNIKYMNNETKVTRASILCSPVLIPAVGVFYAILKLGGMP